MRPPLSPPAGKQREADRKADLAVGAKQPQAEHRVVDIERHDLAEQEQGGEHGRRVEPDGQPGQPAGKAEQQQRAGLAGGKERFGALAEQQGG